MSVTAEKAALRRRILAQLAGLSPAERERSDAMLFERFLQLPQVQDSRRLLLFLGVPGREPDTARLLPRLLASGYQLALPRMLPEHGMEFRRYDPDRPLVQARFGIREPGEDCPLVPKGWGEVILVPGAAFDREGCRLGFGGGYYDRWLPGFPGFRVGLCREAALQDRLPQEPHDCRVDRVLTEKEEAGFLPLLP